MPSPIVELPNRPLRLRPPVGGWRTRLLGLVCVLLFGGGCVWLGVSVAPGLVGDYAVRGTALPLTTGRISDGRCHSKLFLVSCDITLSSTGPGNTGKAGARVTQDVHYLFADIHFGDYTVAVMSDPARPGWLTTDIGIDRYWNRAVTFVLMAAFSVAMAVFGLIQLVSGGPWATAARRLDGQVLVPAVLRLRGVLRQGWAVDAQPGERFRNGRLWPVGRQAEPLVVGPGNAILGVTARSGGPVVPMDAGLTWLDLTEEERRRAFASLPRPPG
ncbi:hypothetical protein M0638_18895 [Roseomonas sp. NAR14]|uniref:Uncharacterized protein n=1 Tax=Roseomonas acroporae TaxID=2937791 RepID=A0A9X2BV92_9PROT|nr:hypothetical protein [Roseomonas acroporae]MCK8786447.1 hypothetical protein [Roseomonas acroporae]